MNSYERRELREAIANLRSGSRVRIIDGERALLRLASYSAVSCSCADAPRRCTAHPYVEKSVLEAVTSSNDLRNTVRAIRAGLEER